MSQELYLSPTKAEILDYTGKFEQLFKRSWSRFRKERVPIFAARLAKRAEDQALKNWANNAQGRKKWRRPQGWKRNPYYAWKADRFSLTKPLPAMLEMSGKLKRSYFHEPKYGRGAKTGRIAIVVGNTVEYFEAQSEGFTSPTGGAVPPKPTLPSEDDFEKMYERGLRKEIRNFASANKKAFKKNKSPKARIRRR